MSISDNGPAAAVVVAVVVGSIDIMASPTAVAAQFGVGPSRPCVTLQRCVPVRASRLLNHERTHSASQPDAAANTFLLFPWPANRLDAYMPPEQKCGIAPKREQCGMTV